MNPKTHLILIPAVAVWGLCTGCAPAEMSKSFPESRVTKIIVYTVNGKLVATVTDLKDIVVLSEPIIRAQRRKGLAEMGPWNQLAKLSIFHEDGTERRIVLLKDGKFRILGDDIERFGVLDTQEWYNRVVQRYAQSDIDAGNTDER